MHFFIRIRDFVEHNFFYSKLTLQKPCFLIRSKNTEISIIKVAILSFKEYIQQLTMDKILNVSGLSKTIKL